MSTKLLFNITSHENRIAILEKGRLSEIFIQNQKEKSYVGNIYKGKVTRVLPGMQAAFVDIGLERAAFLYVTEFFDEYGDSFHPREMAEEKKRRKRGKVQIQDLLKEGQEVIVQVAKDPIGTKGARLTSFVSLPGRHLVYMPTVAHTGVSRKIDDEDERKRLREIVQSTQKMEGGFIIRTASAKQPANNIVRDVEHLEFQWKKVMDSMEAIQAPAIIHHDLELILRAVRDFYTDDIDELIVDDKESYRKIKQFITQGLPKKRRNVVLHEGPETLFNTYDVDKQIDRALGRRVWLKSGGYLIFDHAEALTAVDVNTGRYVGKKSKSLEDTIVKTNLEAVSEICAQLRLRNIGGLIILDFIDMDLRSNRNKIFNALEKELEKDKNKTNILKMSDLGLIEMTRKRTRENLTQQLCQECEYCDGKGFHKSARTMAYTILRNVFYELNLDASSHHNLEIVAHHHVASILKNEEYQTFIDFEKTTGRRIVIREQGNFHPENYQINLTGSGEAKAVIQSLPHDDEEE
ncbi:MAG: Rne/Rng family ribonuclease [Deltaproteobacteria bacterium]|nr:Rne/Rng family ribonuclease [Deltaproteobacteria bacterium]